MLTYADFCDLLIKNGIEGVLGKARALVVSADGVTILNKSDKGVKAPAGEKAIGAYYYRGEFTIFFGDGADVVAFSLALNESGLTVPGDIGTYRLARGKNENLAAVTVCKLGSEPYVVDLSKLVAPTLAFGDDGDDDFAFFFGFDGEDCYDELSC